MEKVENNKTTVVNINENSIELNKTTKGYTYSVKCYGDDLDIILERVKNIKVKLDKATEKGE
jgi:hypothetical protein